MRRIELFGLKLQAGDMAIGHYEKWRISAGGTERQHAAFSDEPGERKSFYRSARWASEFCSGSEKAGNAPQHEGIADCNLWMGVVSRAVLPAGFVYGEARVPCLLCLGQRATHVSDSDWQLPDCTGGAADRMG